MAKIDKCVLDMLKCIKNHCSENNFCNECKFINDDCTCMFSGAPNAWKIPEKEILDEVEKEYLWNIIKPFKDKIDNIHKANNYAGDKEGINIVINSSEEICLPFFKKGKMYIGMKLFKKYTVKELFGDDK